MTSSASRRRFIRPVLLFLLNVLQAVVGPTFVELAVPLLHATQLKAILWNEYLLSAAISAVCGYFIYRKWLWREVLWVWAAGFAWLGLPALVLLGSSGLSFAFSQLSGVRCGEDTSSCKDWIQFTIPFVRMVSYSAGGWVFIACGRYRRGTEGPRSLHDGKNQPAEGPDSAN